MSEKKIGRYTIKSELGRGGMATVYLAYDPVLEREVALKLLPTYFAHDPEFSARFEREAKTVAALEHGSIISMYDYGEDGEWPYFVMRLMKGGSLKERIANGPMSLEEAARIVERVAGALDKAHSKNIVHRDLKPGNIMFDEDGAAYLGDFGIVKLAEGSESHTRTGNMLGTEAYMSPEQVDGKPDIDGRSDIYSLGIVLYEMLTGTAPYSHKSRTRLLMMHLEAPTPNLLEKRPDLPPRLQTIIEKAMAKKRENRYATAGEMAEAVQTLLAGKAVAATAIAPSTPPAAKPQPQPTRPAESPTQPNAAPTRTAPTRTAPAKSGIPTWAYAIAGIVVIALIGVFALGGNGGDDDAALDPAQIEEPAVVEPTAVSIKPTTATEPTSLPAPTAEPDSPNTQPPVSDSIHRPDFNYFTDVDGWSIESLIESDEFDITNGQATFITRIEGTSWITYDDLFGSGTYAVDVMMPDAKPLTTGAGMVFMFDDVHENWYEFILDSDGRATANRCLSRCDELETLFHNEPTKANTRVGAMNNLRVEVGDNSMIFYVNDEKVGSTSNRDLTKGSLGLILFTDIDQDVKVVYDNFNYAPTP